MLEDSGAKRGKQLISILAGGSALYVCWQVIVLAPRVWQVSAVSALLFAYGIWIFFAAKRATVFQPLDFAMSNKVSTQFVTQGPYRYVRHPFYSAYCAAWIASLIQLQSWPVAAICIALIEIYVRTALSEEQAFKKSAFASEYETYTNQTGMLIPACMNKVDLSFLQLGNKIKNDSKLLNIYAGKWPKEYPHTPLLMRKPNLLICRAICRLF